MVEPEWDDASRAWAMALQWYRDHLQCPRCGGPAWVCQAPDAEFSLHAKPPTRCWAVTAIRRAQEERKGLASVGAEDALIWGVGDRRSQ